jgi:hypothetical protein
LNKVNYNVTTHYGEDKVRSLFQDYTQHIIDIAFDDEEFPDEATRQQEFEVNHNRIVAWKHTKTFSTYQLQHDTRIKMCAM